MANMSFEESRKLCLERKIPEDKIELINNGVIKRIAEFLEKNKSAVFDRISTSKNIIIRAGTQDYVFNRNTGQLYNSGTSSKLVSAFDASYLVETEILRKYPNAEIIRTSDENGSITLTAKSDLLCFSETVIEEGFTYTKKDIKDLSSLVKATPKPGIKKEIVEYIKSEVKSDMQSEHVTRALFKKRYSQFVRNLVQAEDLIFADMLFKKGIDGSDLAITRSRDPLNGTENVSYSIRNTGRKIDIEELPPTKICTEIKNLLKKLVPLLKNEKKYEKAIDYIKGTGGKDISLIKNGCLSASFNKFGRYQLDPLHSYKRNLKSWLSEQKKEEEKKLTENPLYGEILPVEMMKLMRCSRNKLTQGAIVKIMRGYVVNPYYRDAEINFKSMHNEDILFSFVPDDTIEKCLSNLEKAKFVSANRIKGTYGSFDIYRLTKSGEEFLSFAENKEPNKGEYAIMQRLVKKTDTENTADCIKALDVMLEHSAIACSVPEFFMKCALNDFERTKTYLNMQLALSDDENQKKTIRKMKKIIMDEKKKEKEKEK